MRNFYFLKKNRLILLFSLILIFCSKGSDEIEIEENKESVHGIVMRMTRIRQYIFQLSNRNYAIKVRSPDSDDYILNGKDKEGIVEGRNPKVTVKLGDTLTFNIDAFGHPFYLKTLQGMGTDDLVTGADNNGVESGTVIWTPTKKGIFYYQCSLHNRMFGEIIVE